MAQAAFAARPTVVSSHILSYYRTSHNGARKTHAEWYADDSVALFRSFATGHCAPDYLRLKVRHLRRFFMLSLQQRQTIARLSIPGEGTVIEAHRADDGSVQFIKHGGKGRAVVPFRLFSDEVQAFVDFCVDRLVDL